MSLGRLIKDAYQQRIKLADVPADLRQSLKAHERIPAFFANLERELSTVPNLRQEQIIDAVYSLTDMFISAVKRAADERMISDVAKSAITAKADAIAKRDALADRLLDGKSIDMEELL